MTKGKLSPLFALFGVLAVRGVHDEVTVGEEGLVQATYQQQERADHTLGISTMLNHSGQKHEPLGRPAKFSPAERDLMIQVTNIYRCYHGQGKVTWDFDLEALIVQHIQSTNWNFWKGHAPDVQANFESNYGGCDIVGGVGAFYHECTFCAQGCTTFTDSCASTTGITGHWRSVVSKSVSKIACGFAASGLGIMCRYRTWAWQGNVCHRRTPGCRVGSLQEEIFPGLTPQVGGPKCGRPWKWKEAPTNMLDGCCGNFRPASQDLCTKSSEDQFGVCWANRPSGSICRRFLTGTNKGEPAGGGGGGDGDGDGDAGGGGNTGGVGNTPAQGKGGKGGKGRKGGQAGTGGTGGCQDTADWKNTANLGCDEYAKNGWCANGAPVAGQEWTLGNTWNYPERHCCVCGK